LHILNNIPRDIEGCFHLIPEATLRNRRSYCCCFCLHCIVIQVLISGVCCIVLRRTPPPLFVCVVECSIVVTIPLGRTDWSNLCCFSYTIP
jgi:hypothetical protein